MRQHRNPQQRLPKRPPTNNPQRRPTRQQAMRATFEQLVLENPGLASAVLRALRIIAGADRRRAMLLIEAVSAIVLRGPKTTPEAP